MTEITSTRRDVLAAIGAGAALMGAGAGGAQAQGQAQAPAAAGGGKVLRIGVLGVMRGPAASWGLVNKYCAETTAEMWNEQGGVEIGGERYRIEVTSIDDQLDPRLAIEGAQRLLAEGARYIIGPNVDTTAAVIVPLLRANNAVNVAYGFARYLYAPPQRHSILGMIASYQASPIIYDHLRQTKGIRSISFVARREADSLNQRDENVIEARRRGLVVVSSAFTYEPGTLDFKPVMARVLGGRDKPPVLTGITGQLGGPAAPVGGTPDLVELSGVAPADAPLILLALRELGYKGLVCTETAQDALLLRDAGEAAEGFISVGGASAPEARSPYMEDFVRRYTARAGRWHDEAGTKVYALETILRTLQAAGPAALEDTAAFLDAIPAFAIDDPFLKDQRTLRYGGERTFNQPRQIGVPLVVNEYRGGTFQPLFVGSVA
jgi:branched-chain amino acid transport system substrate-binding protein